MSFADDDPCGKHLPQHCLLSHSDDASFATRCAACDRTLEEIDHAAQQLVAPLRQSADEDILRDLTTRVERFEDGPSIMMRKAKEREERQAQDGGRYASGRVSGGE